MGNKCCCAPSTEIQTDGGDLPKKSTGQIGDSVLKKEYSYPFYRMDVSKMFDRIHKLDKDEISLADLQKMLGGAIWNGKFQEGSDVYELLESLPNKGQFKYDKLDLLVLCYLYCGGDKEQKIQAFFNLINPPDQAQDSVAQND